MLPSFNRTPGAERPVHRCLSLQELLIAPPDLFGRNGTDVRKPGATAAKPKHIELMLAEDKDVRSRVEAGEGTRRVGKKGDQSLWHNQGPRNRHRGRDVCKHGAECERLSEGRQFDPCGACAFAHTDADKARADRVDLLAKQITSDSPAVEVHRAVRQARRLLKRAEQTVV